MKLVVIGFGQCGGRIADAFARLRQRAHSQRGIQIITDVFAVNTDTADLSGLYSIKADYQHRILIGGGKTKGHGVAKMSELGAQIAMEDSDKVVDALRTSKHFTETDAFLLIAGAAGGTGSGAIPVMAGHFKERYASKPVYSIVVLPFEHEENTETRTIHNTAACLKSAYYVSDAVILVDNQRFITKDLSISKNINIINELIVEPFYNLLCAGEEKKAKRIGTRVIDAGDIMQTLAGWTAIGYGKSNLPLIRLPFERSRHFRKKSTETDKGIKAMDEAISSISIRFNTADARRALYLLCGPAIELNMHLVNELNEYLRTIAPESVIRVGDYPVDRGVVDVTVVFSEIEELEKVRAYYMKAEANIRGKPGDGAISSSPDEDI